MRKLVISEDSLVVPMAIAGSGKSTWIRANFNEHERVSSDFCRFLVCGDEANQACSGQAFRIFHTLLDARMSLGNLTVADATNLRSRDRAEVMEAAKRYHREAHLVIFDVDYATAFRQNAGRERVVPLEAMERMNQSFLHARKVVGGEDWTSVSLINPFLPCVVQRVPKPLAVKHPVLTPLKKTVGM